MNQDPADKEQKVATVPLDRIFTSEFKIPEFSVSTEIPESVEVVEPEEPEYIILTADEIKSKTDDELVKILSGESHSDKALSLSTQSLITTELISRSVNKASKPHWTITPSFIVIVVAMVFSGIAAWPVIQEWLSQKSQPDALNQNKVSSQQSPEQIETSQSYQEAQQPVSATLSHDEHRSGSERIQQELKSEQGPTPQKQQLEDKNSSINQSTKN